MPTTNNNKVVIAFDIDFTMTTGDLHQKVFGEKYPGFDINKHYDIYPIEDALIKYGFEQEGFDRYAIYTQKTFELFGVSPLEPWFVYVYNHIKEMPNVEIHFITARNQSYAVATKQLLDYYNIPFTNTHIIGGYHKEELIEKLGVSIIFEDNTETVHRVLEECPNCHTFLVDRLYNHTTLKHPRLNHIDTRGNHEDVLQKTLDIINNVMNGYTLSSQLVQHS